MGNESALFVASPDRLSALCPGWKLALTEPETRTVNNPFTRTVDTVVIETASYNEDDTYSLWDWERFREARLPVLGQELSAGALKAVAGALSLDARAVRRALSEPPDSEAVVFELAAPFVEALAASTHASYATLGRLMRPDLEEAAAVAGFARLREFALAARDESKHVYLVEEA